MMKQFVLLLQKVGFIQYFILLQWLNLMLIRLVLVDVFSCHSLRVECEEELVCHIYSSPVLAPHSRKNKCFRSFQLFPGTSIQWLMFNAVTAKKNMFFTVGKKNIELFVFLDSKPHKYMQTKFLVNKLITDFIRRLIVARTDCRQPCMNIHEGEAWGLLSVLKFVKSTV